jgi:hypothetical protein
VWIEDRTAHVSCQEAKQLGETTGQLGYETGFWKSRSLGHRNWKTEF